MNYTTNFNLNKPEGTDLYNHLTVDNPNMDTIDAVMQANKLASVGSATELVSGTVHAITRLDSNQNIFKFKATGDFHAGDTITVDGVSVNAYLTSGEQLPDDAYIISANVICVLDGTSLWVVCSSIQDAAEVPYTDTDNIGATNVQDAIDYVNNKTGAEITYSGALTINNKIGLINQHGVSWDGPMTVTLDTNKYYQLNVGLGAQYTMCYIYYDSSWLIQGTNNAGVTISGNNLIIPRYGRWLMTSF